MALTVVKRPYFVISPSTGDSFTVSNSGGEALFTSTAAHGITTDQHIYVYSNLSAYNGEWRAIVLSATTLKLRRFPSSVSWPNQTFVNSGSATIYREMGINSWNAVHLPIVYTLISSLWPTNSVDTARTISSFANSNGYTEVTISGDIKASGSADALEQVKISGTASLDGIYRIISWSSDVKFVIDLSYSASNSFTGGTIQYYYGNYRAVIRIYAGLRVGHYWRDQKPFELVGTIEQQPDADGLVIVNINEFVKKQISIMENNLLLDTLPNNIDAWCEGYIEFAESYDDANQYGTNDLNVTTYTGPFTSELDTGFVFKAINASLPFKTRSGALMNGYVYRTGAPLIKFLTNFTTPVLFAGKYFDVSFIIDDFTVGGYYIYRRVKDSSDNVLGTFADAIPDRDIGVYRHQVSQSAFGESTIEITLFNSTYGREVQISETLAISVNSDCSSQDFYVTWLNHLGGFDYWNFNGETTYGIMNLESRTQQKNIFSNWPNSYGEFADSIEKQTARRTKDTVVLNSGYMSSEELDGLVTILESPLVQKINSIYDRRTILLGNSSQNTKIDNQKLLMLTVEARYTDENPSQSL